MACQKINCRHTWQTVLKKIGTLKQINTDLFNKDIYFKIPGKLFFNFIQNIYAAIHIIPKTSLL